MIDLHCHILPAVDDGAVDLPEAIAMARDARDQGCEAVIATSHLGVGLFDTTPELLEVEHRRLTAGLDREGISLDVLPGAENFLSDRTAAGDFAEKAVTLGRQGPYVLLDFSLRAVPSHLGQVLDALRALGRRPIVAHPERNRELQADLSPVGEWVRHGVLLQINASSLLGYLGRDSREAAERLLAAGAGHILASDAHDRGRRPFCLARGREAAARIVGSEEAERMTSERPWRIARGEPVETTPIEIGPSSTAKRWLRRFTGRDS
jgi:protein-tyrosine phosphatase